MKKENILARFDRELNHLQLVAKVAKENGEDTAYLEYASSALRLFRDQFDFMWVSRTLYLREDGTVAGTSHVSHRTKMGPNLTPVVVDLPTPNADLLGFIRPHGKTLAQIEAEINTYK